MKNSMIRNILSALVMMVTVQAYAGGNDVGNAGLLSVNSTSCVIGPRANVSIDASHLRLEKLGSNQIKASLISRSSFKRSVTLESKDFSFQEVDSSGREIYKDVSGKLTLVIMKNSAFSGALEAYLSGVGMGKDKRTNIFIEGRGCAQ